MHKNKAISLIVVNTLVAIVLTAYVLQSFTVQAGDRFFNRIATFPVYLNTDIDLETVAEIVDASKDGKTLVYTDSQTGKLGFVDIKKPSKPEALGAIDVGGEPTSVAVVGDYALVAVNTSPSFVAPSGHLHVVDIKTQSIVATHVLAGQPDSVAVSPDEQFAAVVIENERDEDLGNGEPPQAPSGLLQIIDLIGAPADWSIRDVNLGGIADLFPDDAEPEYVDINEDNIAVVTMQENNYIVLIDLATGNIINHFTAGTVDLHQIDTQEEDPALISLTESEFNIPREPDGVTWISNKLFATADEGDLFGGSRGFTVFDTQGNVVFSSGNTLEHEVVRLGHYPDDRSGNKGNEPENVEFADFGDKQFLFVASERSSVIFVYKVNGRHHPGLKFVQTLPAGVGPEGIKAIPKRNLLVAASENDSREDVIRGVITIYKLEKGKANYPTVISANRVDGTPIPWGALSGFALHPRNDKKMYAVHDSFYQQSRIYVMNIRKKPAVITDEIILKDHNGNTVNLDAEGIAVSASGDDSFWIASEGAGSVDDPSRPVTSLNLLVHVAADGTIIETVTLPDAVNAKQRRFGFEGVASVMEGGNEVLYVAFQRAWVGDPESNNTNDGGMVRIGRYDTSNGEWTFAYYPLEVRQSPNGGWVGLSEIIALGEGRFAVVERDNQGNTDARIKHVYEFSVADVAFRAEGDPSGFDALSKTLVRDLIPDLEATGGMVLEKIESLAVNRRGDMFFANDNDGVDDSNGETQLIRVKNVFKPSYHSHDFDYGNNDYDYDDDEEDDDEDDE